MLPILDTLSRTRVLMDGAMGTFLQLQGLPPNTPSDAWTLNNPQAVEAAHRQYRDAGARLLLTNTFGSSRNRLKEHGLDRRLEEINRRAVELCRKAAGDGAYVGGSVGPVGSRQTPFERLSFYEAADIYQEQIVSLLNAGIDLLVLETLFTAKEVKTAAVAAEDLCRGRVPILLSMSLNARGRLACGGDPVDLLAYLEEAHVAIVGLNCSHGPESLLKEVRRIRAETKAPLAVKPNAGLPVPSGYPVSAGEFAEWGRRFFDEGVRLFGGCCGTTPEYIRELARETDVSGAAG